MSEESRVPEEIRGVLIPLNDSVLLLPNAAVAEVIDYRDPDPIGDAPDWLLGSVSWRQRTLMMVSYEKLLGEQIPSTGRRRRIAVCHALEADAKRPFIGVVAQGIPRLVKVHQDMLVAQEMEQSDVPLIARALLNGETILIPDLDALEVLVSNAA